MAGGGSLFAAEQLAAVEIETELMLYALETVAESYEQRRKGNAVSDMVTAYVDFYGLDLAPDDTPEPEDLVRMAALASRVSALMNVLEQGKIASNADDLEAIAEAACSAALLRNAEKPTFQLLDFLSALERARAGLG